MYHSASGKGCEYVYLNAVLTACEEYRWSLLGIKQVLDLGIENTELF